MSPAALEGRQALYRIIRQLKDHGLEPASKALSSAGAAVRHSAGPSCCPAQSSGQLHAFTNPAVPLTRGPASSGICPSWLPPSVQPGSRIAQQTLPSSRPYVRQLHQAICSGRTGVLRQRSDSASGSGTQLKLVLRQQHRSYSSAEPALWKIGWGYGSWGRQYARLAWARLQEKTQLQPYTRFVEGVVRPVVNSLYSAGGHVQRLLPLMVAEVARRDNFASSLAGPSVYDHRLSEPETHHSLPVAAALAVFQTLSNLLRLMVLMVLFSPVMLTAPLALQYNIGRPLWLTAFRKTLELAGPAFMKWGQWAATRADTFPRDMCAELAELQTSAPAHSYRRTKSTVESALGAPIADLFTEFEKRPVASGSIGQIHRATLSERGALHTGVPAGTVVAVKVRHPGVGAAIARDFGLMMGVAQALEQLPSLKKLRPQESLRQFAAPLREQVDLAQEGRHLWQFNWNFRQTPSIRFPYPIYPLVSPEVLVETFETGDHITKYIEMGPSAPHNARLAALGSGAMLQMMLQDNFIHMDLHPGNILVHMDSPRGTRHLYQRFAEAVGLKLPEQWNRPAIVLLDVGMATHLTENERANMVDLFRSFTNMDGAAMARTALHFSTDQQSCPDPQAFIDDCKDLFDRLKEAHSWGETAYDSGADAMAETLEIIRKHEVTLPGQVCAVLVTTLVLEGWSSKLAPQHSVLGQVERLVAAEEAHKRSLKQRMRAILGSAVETPTPRTAFDLPV